MIIYKLDEFIIYDKMAVDFIGEMNKNHSDYENIIRNLNLNKPIDDLDDNIIIYFSNIISNLIKNINIEDRDNIISLLTICTMSIIYMNEILPNDVKLRKDIKSMLEELKLGGVGNGIVKKIIKCFDSIKIIANTLSNKKINTYSELFNNSELCQKLSNAVNSMIEKYKLDLDSLPDKFNGLKSGIENNLNTLINDNFSDVTT
jgi:hypothetical protein